MIGPDLVRARRRGDKLLLQALKGPERERALHLSEELLRLASVHVDENHEDVESALSAVDRDAREEKLFSGLRKLVMDACRFDAPANVDAGRIRRDLFMRAARARQELEPGQAIDRSALVAQTASALDLTEAQVEQNLFGDLRGAQQLIEAPDLSAEELVGRYEIAQVQGILLRAVRVVVELQDADAHTMRSLFFKLKFRQLLYRVERVPPSGYRIVIDGPFSLFDSVTKYGQKLALVVPVLQELHQCTLMAEIRWGKERKNLVFEHRFTRAVGTVQSDPKTDADELVERINTLKNGISATPDARLLDLPGVGVVAFDLALQMPEGDVVLVEILGFWSREAVWRRVEWAEQRRERGGGGEPVLFAVSSRLRVSETALPEGAFAALHVYKGRISAKALCRQAEELVRARVEPLP